MPSASSDFGRMVSVSAIHFDLPWLAVKWPWSALALPDKKPLLSLCRGTISGIVGSFWSGRVLTGWRALTIESSLMNVVVKVAPFLACSKNPIKGPGIYCWRMRLISQHSGILDNTMLPPCAVKSGTCIYYKNYSLLTMAICV